MTSHFEVLYRNHQKGRIRRMLATIWRADVQSSQAQQRRTAFPWGGQTHLGDPAGYGLRGECLLTVRSV
jgi:hypothetical protein